MRITRLRQIRDRLWAARLMADSEPWRMLGRGAKENLALLRNPHRESWLVTFEHERAGVLVLDLDGPLGGYIQVVCVAPALRGFGLGTRMVRWAEKRIFARHRNAFLCVSSFNHPAAHFYAQLGYQPVGNLRDFIIPGHDEIFLRKTVGPLNQKAPGKSRAARRNAG
jgi:ribosomal protein S18 acetylase RimI-like enzyme